MIPGTHSALHACIKGTLVAVENIIAQSKIDNAGLHPNTLILFDSEPNKSFLFFFFMLVFGFHFDNLLHLYRPSLCSGLLAHKFNREVH
jgi:hypothetical protein